MTQLPVPPKDVIERQAREAAAAGTELRDACPYPFSSDAGKHFIATYLLALPLPPRP